LYCLYLQGRNSQSTMPALDRALLEFADSFIASCSPLPFVDELARQLRVSLGEKRSVPGGSG
jgi:hypothetical protein